LPYQKKQPITTLITCNHHASFKHVLDPPTTPDPDPENDENLFFAYGTELKRYGG